MNVKPLVKYRWKQKHNANGFTLIEVMIAMMILVVGILGIGKMQISAINGNAVAQRSTQAIIAAQSQIEKLMSLSYGAASLSDGTTTNPEGYSVAWTVTDLTTVAGKKIQVIVDDPRGKKRAEFVFIKVPAG